MLCFTDDSRDVEGFRLQPRQRRVSSRVPGGRQVGSKGRFKDEGSGSRIISVRITYRLPTSSADVLPIEYDISVNEKVEPECGFQASSTNSVRVVCFSSAGGRRR